MPSGNPSPAPEFLPLGSPRVTAERCGHKAARLSSLLATGLPVLPGVVWPWPAPPTRDALSALARDLPPPWILRSSGLAEDGVSSSLAGCFHSEGPVAGPDEAAVAFARVREVPDAALAICTVMGLPARPPAVLIQPWRSFARTGVALWPRPGEPDGLRVEGSATGRVVEGEAPGPLPKGLIAGVRLLAEALPTSLRSFGIDLEWGADVTSNGWTLTLLQARPLVPSPSDPPAYMARGTWTRNVHHHPKALSVFYASVIEASRERAGLPQGAWLGRLYEGDGPLREPIATGLPVPGGPLEPQRARLARQTDRFLRFARGYLTSRRPVRPGTNCVAALLAAAPAGPGPGRDRWLRFLAVFPEAWDPQAGSIGSALERLQTARAPGPSAPGDTPWRVFARAVDSREQDDWVFARMLRTLREACLAWGEAAVAAGWIAHPRDAFLLTLAELISGERPAPGLPERRRALGLAQEAHLAPSRVIDGVPAVEPAPDGTPTDELQGRGAVPGQAEGPAGPLPGPGEDAAGRIAVVQALTPQDIVFLPGVAGLVVARPGTCGHAVLIARELGIPTVTGVQRCVERIPTGARVRVDGTSGRVLVLQDY